VSRAQLGDIVKLLKMYFLRVFGPPMQSPHQHIKANYFLIKDNYDTGKIDNKFCPTNEMWADVLTKPLQGQKFRDLRAFLQNCPRDYED
jgi:hypothetical protein